MAPAAATPAARQRLGERPRPSTWSRPTCPLVLRGFVRGTCVSNLCTAAEVSRRRDAELAPFEEGHGGTDRSRARSASSTWTSLALCRPAALVSGTRPAPPGSERGACGAGSRRPTRGRTWRRTSTAHFLRRGTIMYWSPEKTWGVPFGERSASAKKGSKTSAPTTHAGSGYARRRLQLGLCTDTSRRPASREGVRGVCEMPRNVPDQ